MVLVSIAFDYRKIEKDKTTHGYAAHTILAYSTIHAKSPKIFRLINLNIRFLPRFWNGYGHKLITPNNRFVFHPTVVYINFSKAIHCGLMTTSNIVLVVISVQTIGINSYFARFFSQLHISQTIPFMDAVVCAILKNRISNMKWNEKELAWWMRYDRMPMLICVDDRRFCKLQAHSKQEHDECHLDSSQVAP